MKHFQDILNSLLNQQVLVVIKPNNGYRGLLTEVGQDFITFTSNDSTPQIHHVPIREISRISVV